MTEQPLDLGYLSLPAEIQAACEAGPPPSGRIRIEIVADMLDVPVAVDYEGDMAYVKIRDGNHYRCNVKLEDQGLITDYDEQGNLLGVEIFMVRAALRYETVAALTRLLRSPG